MPLPLTLFCVWIVVACVAAMTPQRFHWPAAWVLIGTGIPLLGYITFILGPFWGLICFAAGASILRWPLIRAAERVRDAVAGGEET